MVYLSSYHAHLGAVGHAKQNSKFRPNCEILKFELFSKLSTLNTSCNAFAEASCGWVSNYPIDVHFERSTWTPSPQSDPLRP
jgi:hypothetical protein